MSTLTLKRLIVPAVAILALVYAGSVSVSRASENEGYQPAGSWVWSISFPGTALSVPAMVTLHTDGTVSVSEGLMFRTGNSGKKSPSHGVWERTGPKSFGGTSLSMRYDTDGVLVGFARARTSLHFKDDPDHIEGLIYVENGENCSPSFGCPDPLSPDAIWTGSGIPGLISGTRIRRVEVPE